jgi:exodeoxyribonuclease VII large subunit
MEFTHNQPEYSVSQIAGQIKRVVETAFGQVRVRGELSKVSINAASGHGYLTLKDDKAVLDAVCWRGVLARLSHKPEAGMEVIVTGKLTTYPGSSKYQLVIESLEPAGIGALMAMLEKRKAMLAAEGLFAPARKKPLPYLPEVIGVITSPTGAVIRDILHRIADRFPRHVILWPVAVQGKGAAEQIAAAIAGFNALPLPPRAGGGGGGNLAAGEGAEAVPPLTSPPHAGGIREIVQAGGIREIVHTGSVISRPDLLIVARGGGSVEDLWAFNEEIVVRAAAASEIPLISAVGHETDTTLIDYAADRRAPTPTAAAEMAVPVRAELSLMVEDSGLRMREQLYRRLQTEEEKLTGLARALPGLTTILGLAAQRLDEASGLLQRATELRMERLEQRVSLLAAGLSPARLLRPLDQQEHRLQMIATRLVPLMRKRLDGATAALEILAAQLPHLDVTQVLKRGFAIVRGTDGRILPSAAALPQQGGVSIEFADGSRRATLTKDDTI